MCVFLGLWEKFGWTDNNSSPCLSCPSVPPVAPFGILRLWQIDKIPHRGFLFLQAK